MIYYFLVVILIICFYFRFSKILGSNYHCSFIKGEKNESVETLLNRIDYFNNVDKNINYIFYNIISSMVISFFLCFFIYNNMVKIENFFSIFFITFVILSSLKSYHDHHIKKPMHYYTDKNLKDIRKKLKCKYSKKLKKNILNSCLCDYYIFK